eukprot:8244636-Heterocapsa_arctica.AAC.1
MLDNAAKAAENKHGLPRRMRLFRRSPQVTPTTRLMTKTRMTMTMRTLSHHTLDLCRTLSAKQWISTKPSDFRTIGVNPTTFTTFIDLRTSATNNTRTTSG